jgi:tetratricopeptide (TPR) repeat protein
LRGELDWITMKAIEKDRERRYGTPSELAADIERYLAGLPVLAGPKTVWYRTGKFVRRNWPGVAATAAVLLALGAGTGVATWQARRAERRFAQVRHLANVFLFDFEKSIHNVPGTTGARQLLVKTALEYLRSLSQDASGDPDLTQELAAAYEKVGDILGGSNTGNVGNSAESVSSFQQASVLRNSLRNSRPHDLANRLALVQVLDKLDAVQARTGDLDAALRNSQLAVSLAEALVQEAKPGDHPVVLGLASAYLDLALIEIRHAKVDQADLHAKRALALLEPLAVAAPGERDVQTALAHAYWSVGSLSERTVHYEQAVQYFDKSLPLYEKLVADDPADSDARRRLMITLSGLGWAQIVTAPLQPSVIESGLAKMRRAHEIAAQAVKADPANTEAVSDLVATSTRFGAGLSRSGKNEEAKQVLEGSVRAAFDLVARDPESKENRLNLGQTHVWLATNLASSKDFAGATRHRQIAASIFEKLAAESPGDMKVLDSQVSNWEKIGNLLDEQHDREGARHYYAMGIRIAEPLAARHHAFAVTLEELRRFDQQASPVVAKRDEAQR